MCSDQCVCSRRGQYLAPHFSPFLIFVFNYFNHHFFFTFFIVVLTCIESSTSSFSFFDAISRPKAKLEVNPSCKVILNKDVL